MSYRGRVALHVAIVVMTVVGLGLMWLAWRDCTASGLGGLTCFVMVGG